MRVVCALFVCVCVCVCYERTDRTERSMVESVCVCVCMCVCVCVCCGAIRKISDEDPGGNQFIKWPDLKIKTIRVRNLANHTCDTEWTGESPLRSIPCNSSVLVVDLNLLN